MKSSLALKKFGFILHLRRVASLQTKLHCISDIYVLDKKWEARLYWIISSCLFVDRTGPILPNS